MGAVVVGVSRDGLDSHARFVRKLSLPFRLVTDTGGRLARSYEVKKRLGILPGRVTFIIDREGVIQHVFNSSAAKAHVGQALTIVRRLAPKA